MGSIVTFYSYKGGTGRSMALANVAWILASQGQRVLVVDWDLEAPGLHRYFRPFLADKELVRLESRGVLDLMVDFVEQLLSHAGRELGESRSDEWFRQRADISPWCQRLLWPSGREATTEPGGYIDFVPAGRQGPGYARQVNSFNWQEFYERYNGGAFIEALRENMRSRYDWILIDSRTGVSDTAGICTVQLPDTLVVCFTLNYQSIVGAAATATSAVSSRETAALRILPLATRLADDQDTLLKVMMSYAREVFDGFIDRDIDRTRYWQEMGVRYSSRYAFSEKLAPFEDQVSLDTSTLPAMERLTAWITGQQITKLRPLPEDDRVAVLAEFEQPPEEMGLSNPQDAPAVASTELETLLAKSPELRSLHDNLHEQLKAWIRSGRADDLIAAAGLDRLDRLSTLRTAMLDDALFNDYWKKSVEARFEASRRLKRNRLVGVVAVAGAMALLVSASFLAKAPSSGSSTSSSSAPPAERILAAAKSATEPLRQAMFLVSLDPSDRSSSPAVDLARSVVSVLPDVTIERSGVFDVRFDSSGKRMMTVASQMVTVSSPTAEGESLQLSPPDLTSFNGAALDDAGLRVAFVSTGKDASVFARRDGFTAMRLVTVFGREVRSRGDDYYSSFGPIVFTDGVPTAFTNGDLVRQWSESDFKAVLTLPGGELRREAMSVDGRVIAAIYPQGVDTSTVRAWEMPSARELPGINAVPPGSIALAANGRYLAVTTLDGGMVRNLSATAREPKALEQIVWVTGERSPVDPRVRLAVSSSGDWVATSRPENGEVILWPTQRPKGKPAPTGPEPTRTRKVLPASQKRLTYLAFTPDDKFVMTSDGDSLKFWAIDSARPSSDAPSDQIWNYFHAVVRGCLRDDFVKIGLSAADAERAVQTCSGKGPR